MLSVRMEVYICLSRLISLSNMPWACGRVLDPASNMQVYRPSSSISTPSLDVLPNSNKDISDDAKAVHRDEIRHFAQSVQGDEVRFVVCTYRDLLAMWSRNANPQIREHASVLSYESDDKIGRW